MQSQSYTQLVYDNSHLDHPTPEHPINSSLSDEIWHPNTLLQHENQPQSSHIYPLSTRASDHITYPALSPSFLPPNHPGTYNHHRHHHASHSATPGHHHMPPTLSPVDTTLGAGRVLTRRQRALLVQTGCPLSEHSTTPVDNMDSNIPRSPVYFTHPETSTTHTLPQVDRPNIYPSSPEKTPLNTGSPGVPLRHQSGTFPSPASATSPYSPYGIFTAPSRSDSASTSNPRSASPALSVASEMTSVSSVSAPVSQALTPFPLPDIQSPIISRQKQRKQRLFNVDRKSICEYHKKNPGARQEDIAIRYHVERSTISKILKYKTKWLNVSEHDSMRVAKHRPSKFPEIEEHLQKWLVETKINNIPITDALIRQKAKESAMLLNIPEEKFKASSGWVENFKHRHGIRANVWHGDGKNTRIARALGPGTLTENSAGVTLCSPVYDSPPLRPVRPLSPAISLHPPTWQCSPESSLPMPPPVQTMDCSHVPQGHRSSPHTPLVQHPDQYYSHSAMSSQEQAHDAIHTQHQDSTEDLLQMHSVAPHLRIHSDQTPTIAEAQEACTVVLKYLTITHPTWLDPQQLELLKLVEQALFQVGSGLPVDRRNA